MTSRESIYIYNNENPLDDRTPTGRTPPRGKRYYEEWPEYDKRELTEEERREKDDKHLKKYGIE